MKHHAEITRILIRALITFTALGGIASMPLPAAEIESIPFSVSPRKPGGATLFQLLPPEETGIDLVVPIDIAHPMRRAYYSSMACGNVAIGDVNLDGRPDVFASSGPGANTLYLQTGDLRFENVAEALGLTGGDNWGVHTVLVDIDNDSDLDIYVCHYARTHQHYLNLLIDARTRGKS